MQNLLPKPAKRVKVLLALPLCDAYDYRVPADLSLNPGDFVEVPLARRQVRGVVWEGAEKGDGVAEEKLKDVIARLDAPPMAKVLRRFVDWVAAYTMQPRGAVLKMAMSVPAALDPPKVSTAYRPAAGKPEIKMTAARRRVLDALNPGPPRSAADIAREAGVGPGVIAGLAKAGALEKVRIFETAAVETPRYTPPELSPSQARAASKLAEKVTNGGFSVSLLDGVPGSGKTEVYFYAVAEAITRGRQVLVLLPEIALTGQWLDRFRLRFGVPPVQWHSELSQAARRRTWRAVAEGKASVVVGARSALFLPFADLGLLVVDEEHDQSYKQEEGVIYNARDMSVVRARLGEIPAVLVSATPSLESIINVREGRYWELRLADRYAGAALPEVTLTDMRAAPPPRGRWLSPALVTALGKTFAAGEQAMLFLNRRGYAPLTLCRTCGHRLQCRRCTAWLVEHRGASGKARLQCHHCGHMAPVPAACPECGATESLVACGPGVERLAEEAKELFPGVRQAVAASDTLKGPGGAAELIRRIEDRQVDLIIGTQVVAKGHHFPMLTLVGVVDADLGLSGGDLRAAERTYQLLYQVAGRAGRAGRPGRVLVQTYFPEHPVMAALASGDRDEFLRVEAAARETGRMPPFGRLAAVIVSGANERLVERTARLLGRAAPNGDGVRVLGPAPAPMALLRGRHRQRLLLQAPREMVAGGGVQKLLRAWLGSVKIPGAVRVQVDVDPYSFL